MTLKELRKSYEENKIDKSVYINEIYKKHVTLFDYSEFLKDSDIESIEIRNGQVILSSTSLGVRLLCARGDERVAAIDALNFGSYEHTEWSLMTQFVQNGSNVLDIGANYGWYSMGLHKRFPGARIYAFEPVPKTFDYLLKNMALNFGSAASFAELKGGYRTFDENVVCYPMGFSKEPGTAKFYVYDQGSVNASMENVSGRSDVKVVEAPVSTIDHFVSTENIVVDFLKCDVEGAELFVFQGGLKTLQNHKPIVFTEMLRKWAAKFGYHPNEMIQMFESLGYSCFFGRQVGNTCRLSRLSHMTDETIETNFFFLHNTKHEDHIKRLL